MIDKGGKPMKGKNMKRTLNQIMLFMIILCTFISGILFFEAIKGASLDAAMVVAIITLIACWPTSYWLMYHKGRYDERNKKRARVGNIDLIKDLTKMEKKAR